MKLKCIQSIHKNKAYTSGIFFKKYHPEELIPIEGLTHDKIYNGDIVSETFDSYNPDCDSWGIETKVGFLIFNDQEEWIKYPTKYFALIE